MKKLVAAILLGCVGVVYAQTPALAPKSSVSELVIQQEHN
jgi:hypothetical protein